MLHWDDKLWSKIVHFGHIYMRIIPELFTLYERFQLLIVQHYKLFKTCIS